MVEPPGRASGSDSFGFVLEITSRRNYFEFQTGETLLYLKKKI
jgi:hypothetical protein